MIRSPFSHTLTIAFFSLLINCGPISGSEEAVKNEQETAPAYQEATLTDQSEEKGAKPLACEKKKHKWLFCDQKVSVTTFRHNSDGVNPLRFLHTSYTPLIYQPEKSFFFKRAELSVEDNWLEYGPRSEHLFSLNGILQLQTPKEIYHLDLLTHFSASKDLFSYVGCNLYRKTRLFGTTHHIGVSPLLSYDSYHKKWHLHPYFSSQPRQIFYKFSLRWGLDYLYKKFYPHLSLHYGDEKSPIQVALYIASPFFNPSCPFEIAPFVSLHDGQLWYLDATKYSLDLRIRTYQFIKLGAEAGLVTGQYQETSSFFSPSRTGVNIQSPFVAASIQLCW